MKSEWFMEHDTLSAAKKMLADYQKGVPIEVTEGWGTRLAAALVEKATIAADAKILIQNLASWIDDRNGIRPEIVDRALTFLSPRQSAEGLSAGGEQGIAAGDDTPPQSPTRKGR